MSERLAEVHELRREPADFFDKGEGLVVSTLGLFIRQLGHIRIGKDDGRLYFFTHGVYRGDGEGFVRNRVRDLLGPRFKRRHVEEVLAWLHSDDPSVSHQPTDVGRINLANGLLRWATEELEPHTAEHISINQIPVAWNRDAQCPQFDAFLAQVVPTDAVSLVHEILGYACFPGNPLRKAIQFLGEGANGKTTVLRVTTTLLGSENVSAVPLQSLAENRFASAELYGKLANIAGDLDARAIRRSDQFKMLTGGDPLLAERKHQTPFSFVSYALPIFSANESPLTSDQSPAWFDRWIIVPMERRFSETEQDPHLSEKLTQRDELEGILVHAMRGLRRLMERGHFELPDSVRNAGEAYRDRVDSARGFIDEGCLLHPDVWTPRPALYRGYRRWAIDSGRLPLSATTFYEHLSRALHGRIQLMTRHGGVRGFQGIALLSPDETTASPTTPNPPPADRGDYRFFDRSDPLEL